MGRIPLVLVLVSTLGFACIGITSESAHAHGGTWQGPGGAVPPGMKEPSDPTPPPPPPPSSGQPPVTTPSDGPRAGTPPTGAMPAPVATPTMPGTGSRPTRGPTPITYADWSFWWAMNRDPIENLKVAIYHRSGSGFGVFDLGSTAGGSRTDGTHILRQQVEESVIPTLLWAMDPKNAKHADIESAAYIALGKLARDMAAVGGLMGALEPRSGCDAITRESAALALGLLRRTDEALQFPAADLDRIRRFLFDVFEDSDRRTRERGFAVLSLGLLGDQPTGSDSTSGRHWDAATTTRLLFDALDAEYADADLPVGLLVAIGLQPQTSVTEAQRDVLTKALIKGRLYRREANAVVRSWCAHVIGRVGTASEVAVLQRALAKRSADTRVKRSAAIALGQLAAHVSASDRVELVENLLRSLDRSRDASTRSFGWISVAQAMICDVEAGRTDIVDGTDAASRLVQVAEKGKWIEKPYAALALALVGRAITEEATHVTYGALRVDALDTLRSGLASKRLDARVRSAFAVALGIIGDHRSVGQLVDVIGDRKAEPELRGYAAVAIGLTGYAPKKALKSIRSALRERRSEEMRIHCATALGLLHDRNAVDLLLEELAVARSQAVKGQVVLALAQIGDERAVKPLVTLVRNRKEQDLTRALACAGLGVVGDVEPTASLALLRNGANYRAMTSLLMEAFSII